MWQCPKCNREFSKTNQSHSCVVYSIENHYKNKGEKSKSLFDFLVSSIEKEIGPIKIESLPCCIHLLSDYTFSGVWILKDKIRLDFRVNYKIKSTRMLKEENLSKNRNLYYLEIKEEKEVDNELINWIRDSYSLHK